MLKNIEIYHHSKKIPLKIINNQVALIRRFMHARTNDTFDAANEVKMAYKEGIIAVASAARSIGLNPRSWIIDGHALVQLPHAPEARQNAGQSRLIVRDSSCSYNERYSQKFIMRANISRGDATNVNLCRQLQMQSTRLRAQPSWPIVAFVSMYWHRRAYQMAKFTNDAQQRYDLILHAARVRSWPSTFTLNASFMWSPNASLCFRYPLRI